jgi:hypothetical protein
MSTITVTNIKATGETASRAVSGVAAAWAQFQNYSSNAVNDSFNITSMTDNGVGTVTLNFTNNLVAGQYSSSYGCTATLYGSNNRGRTVTAASSNPADNTQIRFLDGATETYFDSNGLSYTAHGDLA